MSLDAPQKHFIPYVPKPGEEFMNSDQLAHFRGILEALKRQLMEDIERTVHTMQDEATVFAVYDAQNRFGGIADAEFFPYWRNGGAIAGQTGLVKASAYVSPRPGGGSLITAANLSDAEQRASLTLDPARLHASSPPRIQAMMPLGRVESAGNAVTVTIPPYGFVMVEAK